MMSLSTKAATAMFVVLAPLVRASIRPDFKDFPFPEDKINATVSVDFDAYNVTAPFSNSTQPNTSWKAELKVRGIVRVDEHQKDYDPAKDDEGLFFISVAELSLAYGLEDKDVAEAPHESWGFCGGTQSLFNVTIPVDEQVDPSCEGVFEQDCIDWLHEYVNTGGPCRQAGSLLTNQEITSGPCSTTFFPVVEDEDQYMGDRIPEWGSMNNLTLGEMRQQYVSNGPGTDTSEYDALVKQVFVLLASWGERNSSNSTAVDPQTVVGGTVLCLRANETTDGSRSLEEIKEDSAGSMLRGGGMLNTAAGAVFIALLAVSL